MKKHRASVDPDQMIPIPWPITIRLGLLPRGLGDTAYRREVRRIARECLCPPHPKLNEPGLIQYYDARIWKIIKEVMAEN